MMADYFQFQEEIKGIAFDNLLNQAQKTTFIESTFAKFFSAMELEDLPAIKAAIRMSDYNPERVGKAGGR